ncbi:MAG: endonuclease MutS2 [Sandaracinaceae bacterium]
MTDRPETTASHDAARRDAEAKTMRDLEWARLVGAVAARCRGPLRERLDALPLASDVGEARAWMAETEEALRARRDGEPIPLDGVREVRGSLARVVKMGVLDGPQLASVRSTLGAARVLRRYLAQRKSRLPRLHARCALDPSLDALEEEIAACIEPGGGVADHASPELRRLRTEVANLRARIVARLEQMLLEHESVVQDRFLTQREGRYVIPVRTDAHDKIPGIVHGTSTSGATAFVEPRAVVDQQNRLTLAIAEMEREEQRILAQLSDLVRERAPELSAALDALDLADLRDASARLADDLRAWPPEIVDEARIDLRNGRHPLLVLDGVAVVANDVAIEAGRALVLSGPNAGGKTVALKLLGMVALMARAGLPTPAAEGARVGFFEAVLSDVGDEQSMQKNLSTFSAHVRSVARILDLAGARSLVLLDEVATGTDPGEGAALACAIVDALCRRGAAVAVTTHYEPLKAMAIGDARFRNASVGFDVARMAPTFQVRMDVPGASSALAVASRFGLDPLVVERARALLPEQARTFDALVRRLESEHEALCAMRAALEGERRSVAELRERTEAELRKLKERDRNKLTLEGERLLSLIRETREEVRAARRAMRRSPTDAGLVEAAKAAVERAALLIGAGSEIGEALAPPRDEPAGSPPEAAALAPGQRAFVPRLKAEVEIVEGPTKGRVRVAAGAVKLWVDVEELRPVGKGARSAASPGARAVKQIAREPVPEPARGDDDAPAEPPPPRRAIQTDANTLDLRGMRVDDAVAMTESFLDRLYGSSQHVGFIVHGVGTGALRDAVRAYLRTATRYVRRFRGGTLEEGGDRMTVVEIS